MGDEFTKARSMEFPRNVLIGHDIVTDIVPLSKHLNFLNTGMIISGHNTYKSAGNQIKDLLTDDGYSISDFMTGEATLSNVEKAINHAKETKSKFIVAVGGGSKIDIAKMVASKLNIPFISVPTSAAHDGIASNRASLKADMGPKSVAAVTPTAILADTKLISDAPYRYLASGCADVISNLTALKDWDYAHRLRAEPFSSSAHSLSLHAANTIMENAKMIKPNSEESVWLAMRPIIISGISMAVAGSSRPTSGSEHMFSHALDIMHPGKAMHGEQCGVGCIMMMYLHGGDWKSIRNALMKIGAPVNATDLGLKNDDIVDALMTAHKIRPDRFTILGDNGLNRESAENIAKLTMVIE